MDFYCVDIRNLRFTEQLRLFKLAFPIAAICKIFRIPFPIRSAIGYPVRVVRVDESELDIDGRRARLQHDIDELGQAGIQFQFLFKVPMLNPDATSIALAFLSEDRCTYGLLVDTVARMGNKTQRMKLLSLLSPLSDGRFLATVSRLLFDSPPEVDVENVRGSSKKIVRRHRERLQVPVASPRTIDEDNLEGFAAEAERLASEFQIQRNVWVKIPENKVEKLRQGKPRGRMWQRVFGWCVSIVIGVIVWSLGGMWSCPGLPPNSRDDVAGLWQGEVKTTISCAHLQASPTHEVEKQVATIIGVFDSQEEARSVHGSTEAFLVQEALQGTLGKMSNALFYRTTSGSKRDAKPVHDAWLDSTESVVVLGGDSNEASLGFVATWEMPDGIGSAHTESLKHYLEHGFISPLMPPWAILPNRVQAVSSQEENARRTFHAIQTAAFEDQFGGDFGFWEMLKATWRAVRFDPEEWQTEMKAEHKQRMAKLKAHAERLIAEDQSLDPEVLDLYVQWQIENGESAFVFSSAENQDPFAEEEPDHISGFDEQRSTTFLQLQERLGALHEVQDEKTGFPEVNDPLAVYAADFGWFQQSAAESGMRMQFFDPAIAVPAILNFVCADDNVSELTIGFSANSW